MSYIHQGRKFNRDPNVRTPLDLAGFLRDIITSVYSPEVVLDPCCGSGALSVPWFREHYTIGFDVVNQSDYRFSEYHQYHFELLTTWSRPRPELVICNPPFCGTVDYESNKNMMWPERILRTVCSLFGNAIPVAIICPHGFRLNQRTRSRRHSWLSSPGAPKITSIVSLPVDIFPDTMFLSEILIFNLRELEPHYWYVQR